jgi:hypothetical protein
MASESTNTPTPAVPEWAEQAIDALGRIANPENLTAAEMHLLDAAFLLLRHRFGRTVLTDPVPIVRTLVRSAVEALDAEAQA